jgi:hypothetical protein
MPEIKCSYCLGTGRVRHIVTKALKDCPVCRGKKVVHNIAREESRDKPN